MKKKGFLKLFILGACISNVFSQETLILQPDGVIGIDAIVWSLEPSRNYGDYFMLKANAWSWDGDDGFERSFLKFDLSDLLVNSTILEAKLSLYYHHYYNGVEQTHSGENESLLQRVIEPWDEYTLNWNNQPQITSVNQVVLFESSQPRQDYLDIDVTDLLIDIYNSDDNYGFRFSIANEIKYRRMCFSTSDHSDPLKRPKLEILYLSEDCDSVVADFSYDINESIVSFTDESLFADDWFWDFGDGESSFSQNPVHEYDIIGDYTVCLSVDNYCSSDDICKDIYLNCDSTTAFFTYVIDSNRINFYDQSILANSWFWDFGDGFFSNNQNPYHYYESEGEYLVCLKTINGCSESEYCDFIDVNFNYCDSTHAYYNYVIDSNIVYFENLSLNENSSYWDFGNGFYTDILNPSFQYLEAGEYIVCLFTENDCSTDLFCDTIIFNPVNCPICIGACISIYPNPTFDMLYVEYHNIIPDQLIIYDALGRKVVNDFLILSENDNVFGLSMGKYLPGMYIIKVISGTYVHEEKIIKI